MKRVTALNRRAILRGGALLLGSGWLEGLAEEAAAVRFGLLTDVHHGDKPASGTRYYRESLTKLREGVEQFRNSHVDFVIQTGDLVDAAKDPDTEREWVKQAMAALGAAGVPTHSVLGNHCIQTLTKAQFLSEVGRDRGHYSFDVGAFRFVVLDACYRRDGVSYDAGNFDWKDTEIPAAERQWFQQQLEAAPGRVLVFAHQRLDVTGVHGVASAPEVRRILEGSGKVSAVFQGHSHQNDYRQIGGIHYCTMRAVIEGSGAENNGYSVVSVYADGRVGVRGFRGQHGYAVG